MPVDPVANRRFIENLSTLLEDHLASWKSQLADTRNEINELISKASESIPAQAKHLFPEDLVAALLEEAVPPAPPPERIVEKVVETVTVTVPGPASAPDWGLVKGSVSSIEGARTQVDVLTRFLTEAQIHSSRAALLVLRNEKLSGWKALGFDASGGRDDAIKSLDFGVGDDEFVAACLKAEKPILAVPPPEGTPLRRALGGHPPARTLLVPMVIRDRIAGVLCADELPGEEGRLNEAALEVLTFVTGLSVDLLAARKKIPSPALTPRGEEILVFRSAAAAVEPVAEPAGFAVDVKPVAAPAAQETPASPPDAARPCRVHRRRSDRSSAGSAAPLGSHPCSSRSRRPLAVRPDRPERRAKDPPDHGRRRSAPGSRGIGQREEEGRTVEPLRGRPPDGVRRPDGRGPRPAVAPASGDRAADAHAPSPRYPTPTPLPRAFPTPTPEAPPEPPAGRGDLTMAFDQIKTAVPAPPLPPPVPPVHAPASGPRRPRLRRRPRFSKDRLRPPPRSRRRPASSRAPARSGAATTRKGPSTTLGASPVSSSPRSSSTTSARWPRGAPRATSTSG